MRSRIFCAQAIFVCAFIALLCAIPAGANLLRNGAFQDDWLTLLPENQNHHWCYGTGFQNRRDYNPDGWFITGSWKWLNADAASGERRLVLEGPKSEALQRVNWITVHDDRKREGFPDAGGFPTAVTQRSERPLSVVRDVTLRVRVRGENVLANAGVIEVGFSAPGRITADDSMGTRMPLIAAASKALPAGTYTREWIEITLTAAQWLSAVQPSKDEAGAVPLPGAINVAIRYVGATGSVEIERAELASLKATSPNLIPNGGFEDLDAQIWPRFWSRPSKYRYFPPALYYLFNTWHNGPFENRGVVGPDRLIHREGGRAMQMVVPSGDEVQVVSTPIALNQTSPRLIEVSAWVKTDHLSMLQIDGLTESGERLDGFNFIHKAPVSIGTDEWREVRQVFRPRQPIKNLRLVLAARGVNGYTLGDTGDAPQANVVGMIWWDDVRVTEPESTPEELRKRGVVTTTATSTRKPHPYLESVDPGERMVGTNQLRARVVNGGEARSLSLVWSFTLADGRKYESRSPARVFRGGEISLVSVPYDLPATFLRAYAEHKGALSLVDDSGRTVAATSLWFSTWNDPVDLELGALYLAPEQRQFVRLNLGFSNATMKSIAKVRLDVIRRRTGAVQQSVIVSATSVDIAAQRERIPTELREDFTNLLLAEVDVSALPVQPYDSAERNWLMRATVLDAKGQTISVKDSQPFCRQAHRPAQALVKSVRIDTNNLLYVNEAPFLPWGGVYGHVPVYDGTPASGAPRFRDLHNLPPWGIYDRFTTASYKRATSEFNVARYVAGAVFDPAALARSWSQENQLAATAFVAKSSVFSESDFEASAGGAAKLASNLTFVKDAGTVVSTSPGIEEAFGLFHTVTPVQLSHLDRIVDSIRRATGKPVMVGHGGYWNRFEFERVPFFDIYDPETEPLYPANLHTDLTPLIAGKAKTAWLRPQMYEDVPYERWRFHVFVELMRGARGFQIAHGPGDVSLFRGLGGELESLKALLWSTDKGPGIRIDPAMEHWSRRHEGRTYLIAATSRGLTFGKWKWGGSSAHGRTRITEDEATLRDEANSYGIGDASVVAVRPRVHGIQYFPDARVAVPGGRLVQWLWIDPKDPPKTLSAIVKADGRFTHAASWGADELLAQTSGSRLEWFLRAFYRHANGFLGWGKDLIEAARPYAPERATLMGNLPATGVWTKVEVPLSSIGAEQKLIDGIGFIHDTGRVVWGRTAIERSEADPDSWTLWGDSVGATSRGTAKTRIEVKGLVAGTKIRVMFEDREIIASDGFFVDDFSGRDLYQRFGGGPGVGYGDEPVALHVYEIPGR